MPNCALHACRFLVAVSIVSIPVSVGVGSCHAEQLNQATSVDDLVRYLQSGKSEKRRQAAELLFKVAPNQPVVKEQLLDAVRRERAADVKKAMFFALCEPTPSREAVPYLIASLKIPDQELRELLADSLVNMGAKEVLPTLIKNLSQRGDQQVRLGAAYALGKFGDKGAQAAPHMLTLLKELEAPPLEAVAWREVVVASLHQIGKPSEKFLFETMEKGTRRDAEMATEVLGTRAVPVLRGWLSSNDLADRQRAQSLAFRLAAADQIAMFLTATPPPEDAEFTLNQLELALTSLSLNPVEQTRAPNLAKQQVRPLIAALKSKERNLQTRAVSILGHLGHAAQAAGPELVHLFESSDPIMRRNIIITLARVEAITETVVGLLIRALDDKTLVAKFPEDTKLVVQPLPLLNRGLSYQYGDQLRVTAALALARLGPKAIKALPRLERARQDPHDYFRMTAEYAIWNIGKQKQAFINLTQGLKHDNDRVRWWSAGLLREIEPGSPEVIPMLIDVYTKSKEEKTSNDAVAIIQLIGQFGPRAKDAIPMLKAIDESFPSSMWLHRDVALWSISGDPAVFATLRESLGANFNSQAQLVALRAFRESRHRDIRKDAERAAPPLVTMLGQRNPTYPGRSDLLDVLVVLAPAAVPQLCRSLLDADPWRRSGAAAVIKRAGLAKLKTALLKELQADNETARKGAVAALSLIGANDLDVLKGLENRRTDSSIYVRVSARSVFRRLTAKIE